MFSVLLAQANLPGYTTDSPPTGWGPVFDDFVKMFQPQSPNQSTGFLIARILLFVILASGIFFLFRLTSAGYTYLTSGGDQAKIQAAAKEITNSAIGFVIVVSAFFLGQILELVFGINFL